MSDSRLRDTMERGLAAHRANQPAQALVHYRAAIELAPHDAEASSLCGLALIHLGQNAQAMPLLIAAVNSEPTEPGFRMNLALGYEQAKQYDRALVEVRAVIAVNPANARAWDRAGDLAAKLGGEDDAGEAWLRAYSLDLTSVTPALKAAQLQIERKRADLALRIVDSALSQIPAHATLLALKSTALIELRDWQALQSHAASWLTVGTNSVDAWRIAARAAFEQGRHVEAMHAFVNVLSQSAPAAQDLAAYAGICLHGLNYTAAEEALDRAEILDSQNPSVLATRGLLHMYFGRFTESQDCCRRCLAIDPEHVPAYTTLSRLGRGFLSDADCLQLSKIAGTERLHSDYRIPAAFALAHVQDACGDVDAAMILYEKAHALSRARDRQEGRQYHRSATEHRVHRLMELSDDTLPDVIETTGTPRPVFIVGMPRSGTTLIESVLAAHSRVQALGERPAMRQISRAFLALDARGLKPDVATLLSWALAYFRDVPDLGRADHITDKHPLNFEAVSLIVHLFPDAKIIHVRRDPVETCLSVFRQEFNRHWSFTHSFEDIAHYYGQYARLMAHWQSRLPGRITTIQYEKFTADFDYGVPALLHACDLAWEPRCLKFQDTPRPIATFSAVQARDPVRTGNRRAARYERHLSTLTDALTYAGIDLATGELRASR